MSPTVQRVLAHLENVRTDGSGWSARCPAHDDQRNSLHVAEGPDGRALLCCHAGCPTQQVVHKAGLAMSDLFVRGASARFTEPAQGKIAKTYDYLDEEGRLLYQEVRYEPKDFRVRRPKPGADPGEDAWTWNLDGVRRVPYRLPEIRVAVGLQREGKYPLPVFITEGAKDADALAMLGLTATTNECGAGKWTEEHTIRLAGAVDVVILPDNDKPGIEHAQKVAQSLHGKVGRVRVLQLPGLPEKGDVSDWIASGGTRDALEALAEQVRPFSHPLDRYLDVEVGGREFLDRRISPPESLIGDGVLTRPALAFLVAAAGRGKSQLLVQLAVARALGTDWLGLPVKPGRTALVLLELSAYWWQQRIRVAAGERRAEEALNNIRIVCRPDLKGLVDISTDDELAALAKWVSKVDADLLCLDPLSRTHALDENAFTVMGPMLQRIELFGHEYNITTVISHHERKSHSGLKDVDLDVASGSRVISGNATCYMRLVETSRNGPLVLRFSKTSTSGHVPDIWLRREDSGLLVVTDPPEKVGDQNREKVKDALFAGPPDGFTREEIEARTGLGRSAVSKHLSALGAVKVGQKPPRYLPSSTSTAMPAVEAETARDRKNLESPAGELLFPRPEHLPPSTPSAYRRKGGWKEGGRFGVGWNRGESQ